MKKELSPEKLQNMARVAIQQPQEKPFSVDFSKWFWPALVVPALAVVIYIAVPEDQEENLSVDEMLYEMDYYTLDEMV